MLGAEPREQPFVDPGDQVRRVWVRICHGPAAPRTFIKLGVTLPGVELLSPLTRVNEVDPLIDAGATEFFAGVLTPEWKEAFSTLVASNRRDTAVGNFPSLEELEEAVGRAHERKVSVHFTLNLSFYTARQHERVGRLMDAAAGLGIDGFLIADLPTMLRARKEYPDIAVHVSTIAPSFNRSTLQFYTELGAARAVLPRHVTLEEVTGLVKDTPLDLEVFVLNNPCLNVDGFCTFTHGVHEATRSRTGSLGRALRHSHWAIALARHAPAGLLRMARRLPGLIPPPCMLPYDIDVVAVGGLALESVAASRARVSANLRPKTSVDCGACSLRTLLNAGVKAIKIDGRTNDTTRKITDVRYLAALLELARDDGITDTELYQRTRERFQDEYSGVCADRSCYYREFVPR